MARLSRIGNRSSASQLPHRLREIGVRQKAVLLAALFGGALAVSLGAGGAGAAVGCGSGPGLSGIVDVESHLGYQSAATLGTGMVVDGSGKVLTNNHVIRGATSITVSDVCSNRRYSATVLGYDLGADVAVLKLAKASGLPTVTIGNSSKARVGDAVTAIGNAGGIGGTPSKTTGKVVGLNRSITALDEDGNAEQLTGLIQVSASLQAGDSGGPLVDRDGKVIGIDTAGSGHFSFETTAGDGFAVPINRALSIANQIEAGRSSATVHVGKTAFLGVHIQSPGRDAGSGRSIGAFVSGILRGAPAAKAGIVPGDIIYAVGGRRIGSAQALTSRFLRMSPGATVSLSWIDQAGKTHRVSVTLAAGPPQ